MGFTEIVVWDLDSTIANTMQRQWMVPEIKGVVDPPDGRPRLTWADYSAACLDDEPFPAAVAVMRLLETKGVPNFVVTNRNESSRGLTSEWITRHEIPVASLDMRPDERANKTIKDGDHEWKAQRILRLVELGFIIPFVVEDWPETAEVIHRVTGRPVLVVNPCYPADPMSSRPTVGAAGAGV